MIASHVVLRLLQTHFQAGLHILHTQIIFGNHISLSCWLELRHLGAHPLARHFIKGMRRFCPPHSVSVHLWNLAVFSMPFEPLPDIVLRLLSFKTTHLLALTPVKHVEDLTALSVNPTCMRFTPRDSRVLTQRPDRLIQMLLIYLLGRDYMLGI